MAAVFRPERILAGLCLVALGVLWTLNNLGGVDMLSVLRTYWPVTLVVWGLLELGAWWMTRSNR